MTASLRNISSLRIPLRIVLVVPFLILIVLATGLVGYLSYRNEQKAILDLVYQLRSDIDARIQNHLRSFLEIPPRINQLNANAIRRGWLKSDDPDALERHFLEQLQVYDSVTSIYFGNSKGGLVDAGREGMKGSQYIMVTDKFVKGPLHKYATADQNNRVKPLMNIPFFDATARPWYTGAVKKGDNSWSDIYTLVTGQDMAIAASCPVYDRQHNLLGVVSVDIFLSQLSGFLKTLIIGKTGISFIMEHSGLLIASSTDEKLLIGPSGTGEQKRLDSRESSIPLVRHSVEAIAKKFDNYKVINRAQSFDFEIDGQRHFLTVSPFQTNIGLDWLIITVMPESDFMAQINIDNRNTALLIGAILIIVIILCIITAQLITKPIIHLNIAAQSLAKGNWDEIHSVQRLKETGDLTLSFNHMVRQLKRIMGELTSEIEERKQAEEALRENEEKYRNLFENANEAIFVVQDGKLVFLNPMTTMMTGYLGEELMTRPFIEYIHPDDRDMVFDRHVRRMKGEELPPLYSFRIIHKNGKIRWVELNAVLIKWSEKSATLNFLTDITERKQSEYRQSLVSEILSIINESPLGVDTINRILISIKREMGFDAVGIRLRSGDDFPYFVQNGFSDDFLLTENTLTVRDQHGGICRDKNGNISLECTCGLVISGRTDPTNSLFTQGGSAWINDSLQLLDLTAEQDPRLHPRNRCVHEGYRSVALIPIRANQEIVGLLQLNDRKKDCFALDLIQYFEGLASSIGIAFTRKQEEEALKKQLDLFERITETSPVGITLVDNDGSIRFANLSAEKILGLTKDEITGRVYNDPRWHIVDESGGPFPEDKLPFFRVIKTGAAVHNVRHGIKWPDGRSVILSINAAPLKGVSDKVIGMVAALQDITEHKRMEEELLKADKLESVGILAGGIAHDFNNILTSISGNISMAKMQVKPGQKIFDLLSAAETASVRAQGLTRQLLTFAKGGTPVKETVFLKKLIKESSLFVLRGSKSGCEFQIAEDLWPVEADEGQISQVISNIVINANQAMPEGGTIRITAENLMPEKMNEIPVTPGRYIRISIKDQGVGISEKHLSKIFDPYFTTKQAGSGLGLATVYSIIKKHNGYISVELPSGNRNHFSYLSAGF